MTDEPFFVSLPVTVRLTDPLTAAMTRQTLSERVQEILNRTLATLGLPAAAEVEVGEPLETDEASYRPIQLWVEGRPLGYPRDLPGYVYHFVAGEPLRNDHEIEGLVGQVLGLPGEKMEEFVSLIVQAAVHNQPHRLLTTPVAAAYRELLTGEVDAPLQDAAWCQSVLSGVLRQGISLTDRELVGMYCTAADAEQSENDVTEALISDLIAEVIEIQADRDGLEELSVNAGADDREAFTLLRDGLFYELGLRFPAFHWVVADDLPPGCFRFKINALTTIGWRGLGAGEVLVNATLERLRVVNIEARPNANPANRNESSVTLRENREALESLGFTVWTPIGYLVLALAATLRQHAGRFMDNRAAQGYLSSLESTFGELVEAVRAQIPLNLLTGTLRFLLDEEISIRDMKSILQSMLDFDYILVDDPQYIVFDSRLTVPAQPGESWLQDPAARAAFVRSGMKRYISHKYTRGQSALIVYLLDGEVEGMLSNWQALDLPAVLAEISDEDKAKILEAVRYEVGILPVTQQTPVVLTTSGVRAAFRTLVAEEFPEMPVVSYQELSPELNIQPIARISFD